MGYPSPRDRSVHWQEVVQPLAALALIADEEDDERPRLVVESAAEIDEVVIDGLPGQLKCRAHRAWNHRRRRCRRTAE